MSRRTLLLLVLAANAFAARIASAKGGDDELADEETAAPVVEEVKRQTLADRIPSVTSRVVTKVGRTAVTPVVGLSLNDPFYKNVLLGASLSYYPLESLALTASGEYLVGIESELAVSGGLAPARPEYVRPAYAGRLEVAWAPVYGKVNLMAEGVVHFDTYVALGGGVVGPSEGDPAVAASMALGQHYFVSDWVALRVELRDQVFSFARNPLLDPTKELQNFFSFTMGLAFFLPAGGGQQGVR